MSSSYKSLFEHAEGLWGPGVVGGRLGTPALLFHGTHPSMVDEIKRVGLTPSLPMGIAGPAGIRFPEPSGIYLTNLLMIARQVVRARQGHQPVFAAQELYDNYRPVETEDEAVLVISVYGLRMQFSSYFVYPGDIPPSRIRGTYGELQRAGQKLVTSKGLML